MDNIKIFRWLLNVGEIWPSPSNADHNPKSTAVWATNQDVKKALELLPAHEQAKVLRFYHIRDAKLSLGSSLLKHRAIVDTCDVPWKDSIVGEDKNRKPCFKPTDPAKPKMEFNVSHHGTLVALVGCAGEKTKLGVDIVQMNWEKDYPMVVKSGFEAWASTYEMVFSDGEIAEIVAYSVPGSSDSRDKIRAKLRHFYAHWCLKEAYIKMTGEALLAPWLKDLEFRGVKVPLPSQAGQLGQIYSDVDIWFRGGRVTDIKMELQAFGEDYMIGTASSTLDLSLPEFRDMRVVEDICPVKGLD